MSELPYLQMWPKDYLADTRHLTTEQHGAYLLLIFEAWLRPSCSLPDDDEILSRLAGMSSAQWARNKDAVMAFWKRDGRRKEWTQKRLQKEREKAASKSRIAKDSAASRWNQKKKGNASAMQTQCERNAIPDNRYHKDTSVSFSARDARSKKSGFVKLRTVKDAADAASARRLENVDERAGSNVGAEAGDDVQRLPSIGGRRR